MRTCRAELHTLRECGKFRELPPAARFDLVRQHDLCQVCLGPGLCQVKGENCRWRNRIRMELCQENRCRRKHHQLLHVEKGLEEERQGERPPVESSVAASVSGSAQVGEQRSPGQLVAQWIRTPKGGPRLAFWDTGSQVTLITNRAVQAMGLQAIPSPFMRLHCVGGGRGTMARARYKVPLLDIGGRVVTLDAFGVENIMPPLEEGDLASMKTAFPEVPAGGLVTAAGEVSLLVGQDNLSLFPGEKRRVGGAALYGSRFGTGFIVSGRPPWAKGDGGDGRAEACTTVREEHEPKEAADCPEPPGERPESPVCDEVQTATTGITVAQAIGGQGEAEACEMPLPWEEEYDDETTTEEDSRLDWEVEQFLRDSDWEDDEDCLDSEHSYSGWEHGYDADSGWRAVALVAACGATRVMAMMSTTQGREEAAQLVEAAGPRKSGLGSRLPRHVGRHESPGSAGNACACGSCSDACEVCDGAGGSCASGWSGGNSDTLTDGARRAGGEGEEARSRRGVGKRGGDRDRRGEKSGSEGHLSSRDSGREGAPPRPTGRHEAASAVLGGTAAEVVARCGMR
jgi:hypothetical protein